jgi:hypothetical protein
MINLDVFNELRSDIYKYYPIGVPGLKTSQEDAIREKIIEKMKDQSEMNIQWRKVIGEYRKLGFSLVENRYFIEFPNLMASLDLNHDVEGITIKKSVLVCISLLTPYYTYYYTYSHWVKLDEGQGSAFLGPLVFSDRKSYSSLKPAVNLESIVSPIAIHFPSHKFVEHSVLMINKIQGGVPYGFDRDLPPKEYSYYQFLFDSEQPQNIFL